jgi:hypothetical protein
LTSAFVRRGILSLQAATTLSGISRQAARGMTISRAGDVTQSRPGLPMAAISAALYGLKAPVIKVHTASEPKQLAVTGSSGQMGAAQPRSAQSAAESYTEDLFQRGHVEIGTYGSAAAPLNPCSIKTHVIVEQGGQLLLRRRTFDCGFHVCR